MKVPESLVKAYSSGTTQKTTISSFFDIQWRRYLTKSGKILNNGTDYLVGSYRPIQTLIMNDNYEAVEGLVVDLMSGGTFQSPTTFSSFYKVPCNSTSAFETSLTFFFSYLSRL